MSSELAVVTGASGGIGSAVCRALADRGFGVVACGRERHALAAAVESLRERGRLVRAVRVDVADRAAVGDALAGVRSLDALVVNAGICRQAAAIDPDADEVWREVIATNLDGAWNTIKAVIDKLAAGGRIVLVSSGLGQRGRAGYGAYAASKHGLLGLARSLALELAHRGITVNAVCPGWVDTPMAAADLARTARRVGRSPAQVEREAVARIPIGRMVDPEEVAALIGWLISPAAAAITGQAYNICGGEVSG